MESENKIILVIDDQIEIRELVDISLRGSEFNVLQASAGREGIQVAKEKKPDLILLDIMMPGFDGYMTCKVLKRNPITKDIPIIFLTARKTKEDIKKAIQVGGSDYLMKPFDPSDLLTRIRRISETSSLKQSTKKLEEDAKEQQKKERSLQEYITFSRHDDVIVFKSGIGSILLENCKIYRDTFANIVSDGIFKIVLDMNKIEKIDGSGLGLLISVDEALKSYQGGLHITFPTKNVINRFSFIKLNDIFPTFESIQNAVDGFKQNQSISANSDQEDMNLCLTCTYINSKEARYCSFCGTNLVLGKGEKILEVLGKTIAKKVLAEAGTTDIKAINESRDITPDEYEIPKDFSVEISASNTTVSFNSKLIDKQYFHSHEIIGIQAPVINDKLLPIETDMKIILRNPQVGSVSNYETKIKKVNSTKGILYVPYTKDALILHSQKQFSIAPKNPIPVNFINPNLGNIGEVLHGKILEISRIRMIVFSEKELPVDTCMAVNFYLPEEREISTPLAITRKGRRSYMYEIEFKVIDEKESSHITQYMYKRQIELAKSFVK